MRTVRAVRVVSRELRAFCGTKSCESCEKIVTNSGLIRFADQHLEASPNHRSDAGYMKFVVDARALHDALSIARHAVPASPALAVFGGIQISTAGDAVSLCGSDGETTIVANIPASETTKGSAVVPFRPVSVFLAGLPPRTSVTGELVEGELRLSAHGLRPYVFRTIGSQFPQTLAPKGTPSACDMTRLDAGLTAVRTATSKEHFGVSVVSDEKGLHLRTTDHYRLHAVTLPEAAFGDFSGVVPLHVLDRMAASPPVEMTVDTKGRALKGSSAHVSVSARLLNTAFPNVDGVLSAQPASSVLVPVAAFKEALARLSAVSEGVSVEVRGDADGIVLSVANAELGSGSERIDCGPCDVEFSVDRQFLAEALAAHRTEQVTLGYSGPFAPVVLSSSEPFATTTVVMPMRG